MHTLKLTLTHARLSQSHMCYISRMNFICSYA